MSRKKSAEATCPVCGKTYTRVRTRKYCSDECRIKALSEQKHNYYVRMKALALGKTEEEVRAEEKKKALREAECLEQIVERATKLDRKLEELHAAGQTYAEAQRAETIEKFARVEVPEAFQVLTAETPEKPAKEKIMFLSREEREVLIRIQVQVETLQEYFKFEREATGMDYPGVVLGKVLEQVTQLLGEGEA